METFYIIVSDNLQNPPGRFATEGEAREAAERACAHNWRGYLIARVIARVTVDKFPVRWQEAGDAQ